MGAIGLLELLRVLVLAAFLGLTVLAALQWRRRPAPGSGWLVASFGSLTTVLVLSYLDLTPATQWGELADHKTSVALIVAFPYCLYRFMRTFLPAHRVTALLATGLKRSTRRQRRRSRCGPGRRASTPPRSRWRIRASA